MAKKDKEDSDTVSTKKVTSLYDAARLRKLIRDGKNVKEILSELGLTHTQVLKHHLLRLCANDQVYYEIPGLYHRNNRKAFVNAKGEIKLRMTNIDFGENTFPPETDFDVEVRPNQIILTVIGSKPPRPYGDEEIGVSKTGEDTPLKDFT